MESTLVSESKSVNTTIGRQTHAASTQHELTNKQMDSHESYSRHSLQHNLPIFHLLYTAPTHLSSTLNLAASLSPVQGEGIKLKKEKSRRKKQNDVKVKVEGEDTRLRLRNLDVVLLAPLLDDADDVLHLRVGGVADHGESVLEVFSASLACYHLWSVVQ